MGRAIYAHYSDNVAPSATITVNTGTEDPDYLAANLVDLTIRWVLAHCTCSPMAPIPFIEFMERMNRGPLARRCRLAA